jgi:2-oxoglutarate dehydrogenase E1 component
MDNLSYLAGAHSSFIDELYHAYKKDPESVEFGWRKFFEGFEFSKMNYEDAQVPQDYYPAEFKVSNLIHAYRERGHLFTLTNPVRTRRKYSPTLDLENFDLSEADLDTPFQSGNRLGLGRATLREIIAHLNQTYCQSIGVEYRYIRRPEVRDWLRDRMEKERNTPNFSSSEKVNFLNKLCQAVQFEKFIHRKFPGQKRFSLEGAESLIPALDAVIEKAAELGSREFVIGMPHRGRLNVMANIMEKPFRTIFSEFAGRKYDDQYMLGDVKYHLGFTTERSTLQGKVKLTLSPNPSHLEAVNPVVEGIARARIDALHAGNVDAVVPILIHGDASIAGQGVVYEVLQMSELEAYHTGGTIHLVVNNQIGFTTNYLDARSSTYCTDVAKILQSPVFHVNGDDVEAVVYTIKLAMEFRAKFHKDVFIDLLCYRKYGHNEGDEPRFTQPILYKIIEKHPDPHSIYRNRLIEKGVISAEDAARQEAEFIQILEDHLVDSAGISKQHINNFLEETWQGIRRASDSDFFSSPDTGVPLEQLRSIGERIAAVPEGVQLFRKLVKLQEDRQRMLADDGQLDWGMAELMAYGSLLNEGIPIRISGQDVERGTFSHRHAVLRVEDSEEEVIPLNHISAGQAGFEIYNSNLSEYGVLGFEYGYSLASPHRLTIWEAQFGDFFNGAQIVIDQFLSSAEDKWNVMNDLVMLLPHGYEGQGPEHSSARIERFLTLCAENNLQVANCTTPANFFHLLRRQMKRPFRKPLVVFTPKSLLRHPSCVSSLTELSKGSFLEVIDDPHITDPLKVEKLAFCSGKIYYDLIEERKELDRDDIAIIRLEQLYPFPAEQLKPIFEKYNRVNRWMWVQEEPANMGAWTFVSQKFRNIKLKLVARPASGSPATGSSEFHGIRQRKVIESTFGPCKCNKVKEECKLICIGNDFTNYL